MRKLTIKAEDASGKSIEFKFGIAKPTYVDGYIIYEINGDRLIRRGVSETIAGAKVCIINYVYNSGYSTQHMTDEEQ